jgi:DNA polymerase-3 subunit delta
MRISPEKLADHLHQALKPIYLISGDEPLLHQESCDAVRASARQAGFIEREVFDAEGNFDWKLFLEAALSLSLFASRRLLELRIPQGRPGEGGSRALLAYAERPPEDTLLLVKTGKIDASVQKTRWFRALDKVGVVVQVWPMPAAQLPKWIGSRMRRQGLQPEPEAVTFLAQRVEGNLLAAAQEIDRLCLRVGKGKLDLSTVATSVADNARYDVFGLADCALSGDAPRTTRIIFGLRAEGVAPVLILWVLAREIRGLASMSRDLAQGIPIDQVLTQRGVWTKRKAIVSKALRRYPAPQWQTLLCQAAGVDRVIKGIAPGDTWDEILRLSLGVAGLDYLAPKTSG